jgi:hypothetical protein
LDRFSAGIPAKHTAVRRLIGYHNNALQRAGIAAAMTNVIKLDTFRSEGDPELFLVKPGEYLAAYIRHVPFRRMFGTAQQKLRFDFRLLESPGITLSRWYRVEQSRGRISASNSSDIVRELSIVSGQRLRRTRIPVECLINKIVRVKVDTVVRNRNQKNLHTINQYSTISELLGLG